MMLTCDLFITSLGEIQSDTHTHTHWKEVNKYQRSYNL